MSTAAATSPARRCRSARLPQRRHAELHQPERHHRQLRCDAPAILTLTGTASVANYQAALDRSPTASARRTAIRPAGGTDTSRTISWTVTDGSASNGTSNTATTSLDGVHVAPAVTAGATATFTGGGAAVTLDGTLAVSDVDSGGNLDRRDGVDRPGLPHRRHAELHQPERHHRQLRYDHRRC